MYVCLVLTRTKERGHSGQGVTSRIRNRAGKPYVKLFKHKGMQNATNGTPMSIGVAHSPLPGNGTYNSARFAKARKQLADALAAPVFTDAERARAAANAWACDSLYRLCLWLRNVTRIAAERAVVQAQLHTAAASAEALADAALPVLEYGTARLRQCRQFLLLLLAGDVFTTAERHCAAAAAAQCHDLRQLGRWMVSAKHEVARREATGTVSHLSAAFAA